MAIEIKETKDYDVFAYSPIAWHFYLSKRRVELLTKDIAKRGLLSPIIVDKDFVIIDGEHRLEACRKLGIPVRYIVSPNTNRHFVNANGADKFFRRDENRKMLEGVEYSA